MLMVIAAAAAVLGTIAAVALAATSPTVTTGSATGIGNSSATLNGTINPNGSSTSYHFEYGLTKPPAGAPFSNQTATRTLRAGTHAVSVKAGISNLLPGTTYYYRLDALNPGGGVFGAIRSFRTGGNPLPQPGTGPATVLSYNTVALSGLVNPQHQSTTYYFQWGVDGAPASADSTTQRMTLPASAGPTTVTATLYGLGALTSYHYRLVAVHSGFGPVNGADGHFLTFPNPRPRPQVRARTTPTRKARRPWTFTTSGRIVGPGNIPKSLSCFQNVRVSFVVGRHVVAETLPDVASDCTFRTSTTIARFPRGVHRGRHPRPVHVRVVLHFRGNGYLAPSNARDEHLLVG
jgi:phosphodiesterase/alkaline phosphatase D-like protein